MNQQQQQTETFQHYQVLRREDGSLWELGRGAMGVTYKAIDTNLRSHVALKVINTLYLDSDMARQRFVREAKAAASLRHRNVANVYHLGDDGQSFFYSMEFIDGDTVQALVDRKGPLPPAEALAITLQVARALGAAAKQNLVHRDIKPANLMVVHEDDDEDASVVKVIDFGLARSSVSGADSGHITMGGFVGTPQFASPEQLEEQTLDTRSDIYSLGITLWYMLSGNPPFTGSVFRISSQHLSKEPPWEQLEGTPQPVKALLAHMLQKDPANRPQTPTKLRLEIEACLKELASGNSQEPIHPAVAKAFEPTPPSVVDDTLSSASAISSASEAAISSTPSAPPEPGHLFAGRYMLVRQVGEGNSGVVYLARDDWSDNRPVAVKTFHRELGLNTQEFYHLQSDLGRLQTAPHPNLLEVFSLEQIGGYKFSVAEWVRGFTVVDLLRARGRLTLREAMSVLGQACDVATHATANRLHKLELAPHQILINFPAGFGYKPEEPEETNAISSLLPQSMSLWPVFGLKVDALALAREDAALVTWAGDMTMAVSTPRMPTRDTQSSIRGLIEGSYLYALAALIYELLSGAPPDSDRNLAALPSLSETANQVLKRALMPNPGFASEREFFEELLAASDLPHDQLFRAPITPPTVVPSEPPQDGSVTMMFDAPSAVEAKASPASVVAVVSSGAAVPAVSNAAAAVATDSAAVSLGTTGAAVIAASVSTTTRQSAAARTSETAQPAKRSPVLAIAAGVAVLGVLGGVGAIMLSKPKPVPSPIANVTPKPDTSTDVTTAKTKASPSSADVAVNRVPTPAPVVEKPSQDQPPTPETTPVTAASTPPISVATASPTPTAAEGNSPVKPVNVDTPIKPVTANTGRRTTGAASTPKPASSPKKEMTFAEKMAAAAKGVAPDQAEGIDRAAADAERRRRQGGR